MSTSLALVEARARERAHDNDARKGSFSPMHYAQVIADVFTFIGARLPAPHLYTANAGTIGAGAEDFILPSTHDYAGDVRIQLRSNNLYLIKATMEEIDAYRNGQTTASVSIPCRFALYEDPDRALQARCWPRAQASEPYNLYTSIVPDSIRVADLDAVVIDLSEWGTTALALLVAAEIVEGMTDEDLALRRLNPRVTGAWRKNADTLIYKDEARRHNLEATGRVQRWVA